MEFARPCLRKYPMRYSISVGIRNGTCFAAPPAYSTPPVCNDDSQSAAARLISYSIGDMLPAVAVITSQKWLNELLWTPDTS